MKHLAWRFYVNEFHILFSFSHQLTYQVIYRKIKKDLRYVTNFLYDLSQVIVFKKSIESVGCKWVNFATWWSLNMKLLLITQIAVTKTYRLSVNKFILSLSWEWRTYQRTVQLSQIIKSSTTWRGSVSSMVSVCTIIMYCFNFYFFI